jgi:hypothetical protein
MLLHSECVYSLHITVLFTDFVLMRSKHLLKIRTKREHNFDNTYKPGVEKLFNTAGRIGYSYLCREQQKKLIMSLGFEVLTAVSMKMAVFCVVAPCSLVEVYQSFRGPCCLHHQVASSAIMSLTVSETVFL